MSLGTIFLVVAILVIAWIIVKSHMEENDERFDKATTKKKETLGEDVRGNKSPLISCGKIVLAVSLGLGVLATYILIDGLDFKKNSAKSVGTIMSVKKSCHGTDCDGDYGYTAFVRYVAGNKEYVRRMECSKHTRKGDSVRVYYDTRYPEFVTWTASDGWVMGFVVMGFALIPLTVGLCFIVPEMRRRTKKRKLLRMGNIVQAEFKEVTEETGTNVNGRSPYFINCEWIDDEGVARVVTSERFWFDPSPIIEERQIKTFPVYIDPKNPDERYYVSVEELA